MAPDGIEERIEPTPSLAIGDDERDPVSTGQSPASLPRTSAAFDGVAGKQFGEGDQGESGNDDFDGMTVQEREQTGRTVAASSQQNAGTDAGQGLRRLRRWTGLGRHPPNLSLPIDLLSSATLQRGPRALTVAAPPSGADRYASAQT